MHCLQRPPIILLKQGTDSSQGRPQIISNINACEVVVGAIGSTLGPRGMDKLIVDGQGMPCTPVIWIKESNCGVLINAITVEGFGTKCCAYHTPSKIRGVCLWYLISIIQHTISYLLHGQLAQEASHAMQHSSKYWRRELLRGVGENKPDHSDFLRGVVT